jgi:hypothetical protein
MACCGDYRIMAREPGRIGIAELLVGVPFQLLREPVLRRMEEGGVADALVQDAWAGETVRSAVRDYVARTLKR